MAKNNEDNEFFKKPSDASLKKISIVVKYFAAWSNVMKGAAKPAMDPARPRFAFIDLYCGPGRYIDNTPSIPLRVISHAAKDERLRRDMAFLFNDKDIDHVNTLASEFNGLTLEMSGGDPSEKNPVHARELLSHQPIMFNQEVDRNIDAALKRFDGIPTLSLLDPFGVKGLTSARIGRLINGWGCDCIFFFNYNRINLSLKNPAYKAHLDNLFGSERTNSLKILTEGLNSDLDAGPALARETAILDKLKETILALGGKHVFPFGFRNPSGKRLLHCVVLASKDVKAETIWKDILASESAEDAEGIPTHHHRNIDQYGLGLGTPQNSMKVLKQEIIDVLEDLRLPIDIQYLQDIHSPGKNYVSKNYRAALRELEREGLIKVVRPKKGNRVDNETFGPDDKFTIKQKEN